MTTKSLAHSLWPAAFLAAVALTLLPVPSSAQWAANPDPCDPQKMAQANQKKAQFESEVRNALSIGKVSNVVMDPCANKSGLKANVDGCNIVAENGTINTSCLGAGMDGQGNGSPIDEQAAIDKGNPQVKGRATMFGGPADKSTHGWAGLTASGESTRTPGVAVNVDGNALSAGNRSRLGGYWLMHMNDGDWIYRQTDLGPSGWTGNKIDFTAGSLPAHGMSVSQPASWPSVSGTYLGKDPSYAKYNGKCIANCRRAGRV